MENRGGGSPSVRLTSGSEEGRDTGRGVYYLAPSDVPSFDERLYTAPVGGCHADLDYSNVKRKTVCFVLHCWFDRLASHCFAYTDTLYSWPFSSVPFAGIVIDLRFFDSVRVEAAL
jgi:hypothetical protein